MNYLLQTLEKENMKVLVWFLAILVIPFKLCYAQGSFSQTTTAEFNNNTNFNISTANDELKLTNDVGNGADGDLYVPPGGTVKTDPVKTYVIRNNPSGQNAIQVNSSAGFNIGDEVLIITMQDANTDLNNNLAGQYEFKRILSKTATALILDANLNNTYDSLGKKHQVIRVPNYNNVTLDFGATLTCDDWNGSIGGIVVFRAKGLVRVNALAKIDATAKGFLGGRENGWIGGFTTYGTQGEGIWGNPSNSVSNNASSGGGSRGGQFCAGGGGGGSYGTSGTNGVTQTGCNTGLGTGGTTGITVGTQFITRFYFGGAGGKGSYYQGGGTPGDGGDGGGIIYFSCDTLSLIGFINSDGASGGTPVSSGIIGGSGGGAGGTIYFVSSKSVNIGNNFITANGKNGSNGYGGGNGGNGGNGRIRIDAPTLTGTSTPPVGYTGTSYALLGTSTTPLITKPSSMFWGNITYNKNTSAPGTSVLVDILSSTDSVLLSSIVSGVNVTQAGVPQSINSIKLRARLINTFGNQTPILYDWSIDWRTTPTGVKDITTSFPKDYTISQNYPNPFNSNTTIEFSLPRSALVSLKVYNTLGEEVAGLVAEYLQAGSYQTEWNAGNIPSGLYFYRITANNFSATKKLLLLK